ncbi:MAG: hypothetical protein JW718_09680 [Desulfovibrionaceae bacterium]|nr:hypothetical protein [Desulfovibrionaceae bacterium]
MSVMAGQACGRYEAVFQDAASRLGTARTGTARTGTARTGTARVRTRSFGLDWGRFGVRYTARDLDLDPGGLAEACGRVMDAQRRRAFEDECETAVLRSELGLGAKDQDCPARPSLGLESGLAAYQRCAAGPEPAPCRSLLAVV